MDGLSVKYQILLRKSFVIKRRIKMTRKEKFFEIFPNASSYDEVPTISPCELDTEFESGYCQDDMCCMCRQFFWNGEMKGEDFFT